MRILLAEDEKILSDALVEMLSHNNYSVDAVYDGQDAIDYLLTGDTDALDSNGYLYINGGTVNINAQFPFDYDLGGEITGGEVYVNGQLVTSLYNSMMGGGGHGPGFGGGR